MEIHHTIKFPVPCLWQNGLWWQRAICQVTAANNQYRSPEMRMQLKLRTKFCSGSLKNISRQPTLVFSWNNGVFFQFMEGMVHGESLLNAQWLVGVGCVRENGNVIIPSQNTQGRHAKSKNWDQALKRSLAKKLFLVQVNTYVKYVKDNSHEIATESKPQIFPRCRWKYTLKCIYLPTLQRNSLERTLTIECRTEATKGAVQCGKLLKLICALWWSAHFVPKLGQKTGIQTKIGPIFRKKLLCNGVTNRIDFVNMIQIKRNKEIGPTVNSLGSISAALSCLV